ncbi:DUF4386 domain-containing protein [Dyella nitratireducens]|uniref:DUF4386 domain-containing protein n=1 Tax=Dyella nitratireducens TaxID=1849580 RepID=A0ABQ1GHH8_9GAMM|nr:DUF4386 domain-containing protein [Dyella nitratireducens]GGA43346.1 DUF4386 domain-containing protein [Dyella nitratireducens]GLQ41885.1 DUF4386 domain-containing protein [Dyella nitratireducens]
MASIAIDRSQRIAARVAGFLYLLLMACGVFGEYNGRGSLIADNDPAKTATLITHHLLLFRLGIISDLTAFAGDIAMAVALYVLLRPIGKHLALLATFWRVAEVAVLGVITLNSFTMLLLLTDPRYAAVFSSQQLQHLVWLFNDTHDAGYNIGLIFLSLGCIVYSWLFFKSRYVPRLLAGFGLLAYVVMLVGTIVAILWPDNPVGGNFDTPAGLYEIIIGFWLLLRGVREPQKP